VTDKDSQITSDFWHEVCKIQIMKRHLLTVYHSQINDQSKALNQIVEDYLHAYTIEDSTVWACLLSLAQFAYNNSQSFFTGMSSNQLLFDFDCEIQMDIADNVPERRIPAAKNCVKKLQQLCQRLCE